MPEAVSNISGLLGLIGVVAAALVIAKSALTKSTIQILEDNQAALEKKVQLLESEVKMRAEREESLNLRIEALEHTKEELFIQVKSLPAFARMAETIDKVDDSLTELKQETHALTGHLVEHMLRSEK